MTFILKRKITNALRYKSDPSGNVVDLSKHSFSFDLDKLLNKILNFSPTPKRYNKNQSFSDLPNFFETSITIINQPHEQVPFKRATKL